MNPGDDIIHKPAVHGFIVCVTYSPPYREYPIYHGPPINPCFAHPYFPGTIVPYASAADWSEGHPVPWPEIPPAIRRGEVLPMEGERERWVRELGEAFRTLDRLWREPPDGCTPKRRAEVKEAAGLCRAILNGLGLEREAVQEEVL